MYTKILVPLDGSRRAEKILLHVEDLAARYQAEVLLLQVIEYQTQTGNDFDYRPLSTEDLDRIKQMAETYLVEIQRAFQRKKIRCHLLVTFGPVVEMIIYVAQQEKCDIVAMASHGRGGLARVFYGSVAAGVLHRVDRPLLIIRSR
jgi:nucleotide-binding universal stress UspA family protein